MIMNRSQIIALRLIFLHNAFTLANSSPFTTTLKPGNGCPGPLLTLNGTPVTARQNANPNYSTLTEIKFTAQLPLPMQKYKERLCKIKCVAGEWVGPLCQEQDEGGDHFHPVLRKCNIDLNSTNLVLILDNTLLKEWSGTLPDRTKIILRCDGAPGQFKFLGHSDLQCVDGDWDRQIPVCLPTTLYTAFSELSPPTIWVKLPYGNFAIDHHNNQIVAYPGSVVHLECLFRRNHGSPQWLWSTKQKHQLTGWAISVDEREWIYRMSIYYVKSEDSGNYTCKTPKGKMNTISLRIQAVQCEKRDTFRDKHLIVKYKGNHVGQYMYYSCDEGFILKGSNKSFCQANGKWSSSVPKCEQVTCSPVETSDNHLIISGSNFSYKSVIQFRCRWGYALKGVDEIYCKLDGKWSSSVPICIDASCQPPIVPVNGRLIEETNKGKYNIGTMVQFACDKRHQLIGEETIICEENGVWSTSSPVCKIVCEYPGEPTNGRIIPLKFWYEVGDRLKVVCEPGYVTPESVFVLCQQNGEWSISIPRCLNYTEV